MKILFYLVLFMSFDSYGLDIVFKERVITDKILKKVYLNEEICFDQVHCLKTESTLRRKFQKVLPFYEARQFLREESHLLFLYRDLSIPFAKLKFIKEEKNEYQLNIVQSKYYQVLLADNNQLNLELGDVKKYTKKAINDLGVKTKYKYWKRNLNLKLHLNNSIFDLTFYAEALRQNLNKDKFLNEPLHVISSKLNNENEYIGDNEPSNPNCRLVATDKFGNKIYQNIHTNLIDELSKINHPETDLQKLKEIIGASNEVNIPVREACSLYHNTLYEPGVTPLMVVLRSQSLRIVPIVKELIQKGSLLNGVTSYGFNAFNFIKTWGPYREAVSVDFEIVKLFVEAGIDPNLKGRFEQDKFANILGGFDPLDNETVKLPITVLMSFIYISKYFSKEERLALFKQLAEKADVNLKLSNGITALHIAAKDPKHAIELMNILISEGADRNAKDRLGRTPKDLL